MLQPYEKLMWPALVVNNILKEERYMTLKSQWLFLIQPIFRGLGRNPYNNFVGFLVDLKTPKGHFEIN